MVAFPFLLPVTLLDEACVYQRLQGVEVRGSVHVLRDLVLRLRCDGRVILQGRAHRGPDLQVWWVELLQLCHVPRRPQCLASLVMRLARRDHPLHELVGLGDQHRLRQAAVVATCHPVYADEALRRRHRSRRHTGR